MIGKNFRRKGSARGKRKERKGGGREGRGRNAGRETLQIQTLRLLDNEMQMVSIFQGLTDERFSHGTGQFQDG
jgi:hypothetical protein